MFFLNMFSLLIIIDRLLKEAYKVAHTILNHTAYLTSLFVLSNI